MENSRLESIDEEAGIQEQPRGRPWLSWFLPVVVFLLTFFFFLPVLTNEFVNWDDDLNLVENPNYRGLGWEQLQWMFTTFHVSNYRPLTWVTLGLDYLLWGMNPFGYHLTSLLLHAVNGVVFYFVALRLLGLALSGPSSPREFPLPVAAGLSALIFAIHPLRVEPVAWASARNDIVSGLFFLWTMLCYLRAVVVPGGGRTRLGWITAAVIAYGLSLLSKGIALTLPIVLLLLDIYPLRRLGGGPGRWFGSAARRVWWEKVPFVMLAVGAGVIALFAKEEFGLVLPIAQYDPISRTAVTFYGIIFYFRKTILPMGLSPYYPLPTPFNPWDWPFLVSGLAVLGVTVGLFVVRRRWPAGLASWVCYVTVLAPVVGIVQIGPQLVADRYSYLSTLALAILAGGGAIYFWRLWISGRVGREIFVLAETLAVVVLVGLGTLTFKQTQVWHNSERLWRQALSISPSPIAHNNLGTALLKEKRLDEAMEQFRNALEINPNYVLAHNNLGNILVEQGRVGEAIEHYRQALRHDPDDASIHNNLGLALARQGEADEAIQHYRQALKIDPSLAEAHVNLGNALTALGKVEQAIEHYREALKIDPNFGEAHIYFANTLAVSGKVEQAIEHYRQAVRILPKDARIHFILGNALASRGNLEEAVSHFRRVVLIDPEFAEAHQDLSRALALQGKKDEAVKHYQEAQRIMKSRPSNTRGNP